MARVIFIYARPDAAAVARIANTLRAAGHDIWLDVDRIISGESISTVIERGLRNADFVVLCISRAAAERGWIDAERDPGWVQQFRGWDGRILLVRLEEVSPRFVAALLVYPDLFPHEEALAYIDLFPDEEAFDRGIARLTGAIVAHTARRATTGNASAASVPTADRAESSLSQRRRRREVPEMFLVALSFSGVEREFVRAISEAIEHRLGPDRVFFDEWFEFYIGGHDADVKLQRIYSAGCELVVVCVSATYGSKAWTRAEHEAIRARLMKARDDKDPRQRDRVFPVRVGDGDVAGIPFNAIVPDVRERTPDQAAELIVDRLQFVMSAAVQAPLGMPIDRYPAYYPGAADGGIAPVRTSRAPAVANAAPAGRPMARNVAPPTPAYLSAEVQALSEQLERARQRKQSLCNAGIDTGDVDLEILGLRRQLREGGQLRAGDALGDGHYLLIRVIGRGGFAVVWEAHDRVAQQRVAIKVLHTNLAGDPQRRERFFRGALAMRKLVHPAVVRVLESKGEDGGFYYFVMEFVPGGNLHEAVLAQRVPRDGVLPLVLQVGDALATAHATGMVHRDIKPANILLDEQGNAKLTDFDLVGAHDTTGGTRTGALGTVVYAAPECLDRPQEATARADVYGLGMTAIFCLSGRSLSMETFRNPDGTIAKLDCPDSVRQVLARAVKWTPEDRFVNAAEMQVALRHVIAMIGKKRTGELADSEVIPGRHRLAFAPFRGDTELVARSDLRLWILGEERDPSNYEPFAPSTIAFVGMRVPVPFGHHLLVPNSWVYVLPIHADALLSRLVIPKIRQPWPPTNEPSKGDFFLREPRSRVSLWRLEHGGAVLQEACFEDHRLTWRHGPHIKTIEVEQPREDVLGLLVLGVNPGGIYLGIGHINERDQETRCEGYNEGI